MQHWERSQVIEGHDKPWRLGQVYLGVGQGDVRGAVVSRPGDDSPAAGGGHDADGSFLEAAPPGMGGGGGGGAFSDGDEDDGSGTPHAGETAAQACMIR